MKKLMVLLLVLGMAAMANAGLIFTLDGAPQPAEITIGPSEIIELGLEFEAGGTITSYTLGYHLSNDQAEFITDGASGSYPDIDPMTDIEFPAEFDFLGEISAGGNGQYVQFGAGQFFNPALAGPQDLMAELYVHCLAATGDVTLTILIEATTIIDDVTLVNGTLLHELTIHQVPEPMTLSLLGLGGLALRRKRKAVL